MKDGGVLSTNVYDNDLKSEVDFDAYFSNDEIRIKKSYTLSIEHRKYTK